MGRDTGLALDELLDGVARGRRQFVQLLGRQLLRLSALYLLSGDGGSGQCAGLLVEAYLQGLCALGSPQHACLGAIAEHGELHHHGVGRLKRQLKLALQRGDRGTALCGAGHGGKLHGVAVGVGDAAAQGERLRRTTEGRADEYDE